MIELRNDHLEVHCSEVHPDARASIGFQRTLRLPDDNREYPLPPNLGSFPLSHVDDHADGLPESWRTHGGVLLPMHQAEALWISFDAGDYPFAIKIAAGKINAVTGEPWSNGLQEDPQDYVVAPEQPWLDGFCVREGLVRQFVAMPLGTGYTAEEQITGTAEHGGLQIVAYPMKRKAYERLCKQRKEDARFDAGDSHLKMCMSFEPAMGLAPGGLMRQNIEADPHGIDVWDTAHPSRCFVHILNSEQWTAATGQPVPNEPPTAADYSDAGLPWFEHYRDDARPLAGSATLAGLDSVAALGIKKGETPLTNNAPANPKHIVELGKHQPGIRDGDW